MGGCLCVTIHFVLVQVLLCYMIIYLYYLLWTLFNITFVLLTAGADVNATTPMGRSALHLASSRGKGAIIDVLLEKGNNYCGVVCGWVVLLCI